MKPTHRSGQSKNYRETEPQSAQTGPGALPTSGLAGFQQDPQHAVLEHILYVTQSKAASAF